MEGSLKLLTLYVARATEAAAALIIAAAAVQATVRAAYRFITARHELHQRTEEVRLQLGRWLALGLEFELAADILRTAVALRGTRSGNWGRSSL